MNFSEWVQSELDKRGWSRMEAARRSGASASMFDKVINGDAKPGIKFYRAIATLFNMSLEDVLMVAGERFTIPLEEDERFGPNAQRKRVKVDLVDQALAVMVSRLNAANKREVQDYIQFKLERQETEETKRRRNAGNFPEPTET